jgi:hypothetical protein
MGSDGLLVEQGVMDKVTAAAEEQIEAALEEDHVVESTVPAEDELKEVEPL